LNVFTLTLALSLKGRGDMRERPWNSRNRETKAGPKRRSNAGGVGAT
jgi:hypothetical protein